MAVSLPRSPCECSEICPVVLETLKVEFIKLELSDSESLLKKYLTKQVLDCLKYKQTSYGSTLLDCIRSGLYNHDSGIGVYAADPEAYQVFAELFNPIIYDYHQFKESDVHPPKEFGDIKEFGNLDPLGKYTRKIGDLRERFLHSIEDTSYRLDLV